MSATSAVMSLVCLASCVFMGSYVRTFWWINGGEDDDDLSCSVAYHPSAQLFSDCHSFKEEKYRGPKFITESYYSWTSFRGRGNWRCCWHFPL